jgi:hypothetical protein
MADNRRRSEATEERPFTMPYTGPRKARPNTNPASDNAPMYPSYEDDEDPVFEVMVDQYGHDVHQAQRGDLLKHGDVPYDLDAALVRGIVRHAPEFARLYEAYGPEASTTAPLPHEQADAHIQDMHITGRTVGQAARPLLHPDLTPEQNDALYNAGFDTPGKVEAASPEDLDAVPGIGTATIKKLKG